jgi:hypothetical protein
VLAKAVRKLLYRRRVRAVHAWQEAERAEYRKAVGRITAVAPTGCGTLGRPRS